PVWTYADSLSWTKGKHSFKFGAEFRFLGSEALESSPPNAFFTPFQPIPQAFGGATPFSPLSVAGGAGLNNTNPLLPTISQNNSARARDLMTFFAGSVSQVSEYLFVTDPKSTTTWSDYRNANLLTTKMKQREFDMYVKDDFKVAKNLTLNL